MLAAGTRFLPSFLPISEGLVASEASCSSLHGLCREEQAFSGVPLFEMSPARESF